MRNLYFLILLLSITGATAQKNPDALKITYGKFSNGKPVEAKNAIIVYTDDKRTIVTSEDIIRKKAEFPYETFYFDRTNQFYYQSAQLSKDRSVLGIDSIATSHQSWELLAETKMILGHKCHKAKTIINSNTIDIWYTADFRLSGAPGILGQSLGLVLELTRNGNFSIVAEKIEKLNSIPQNAVPNRRPAPVDMLTYRDVLWKARFKTVKVFDKEVVNFSENFGSSDSILRFAKGTIILRQIRIPEIKKGSRLWIDVTERSNGDAYDRTGSVFVIPTDRKVSFLDGLKKSPEALPLYDVGNGKKYHGMTRTEDYSPLIELMRFFTPFGIGQYNTIQLKGKKWQDSVFYRQDITDLVPALTDKDIWIGANISNYDKGGHKISVNLTIHQEEENAAQANNFALPLFDTTCVMEIAGQEYPTMFSSNKGLEVKFDLSAPLRNARLRYITSGHGGWENGDEFLPKKNTIILDGKEALSFVPWRTDCGSYRLYNPASGNFSNGLSSSDYSRSNWCPGTTANPVYIELGNLQAGTHTIQIKIPQGAPEGSSFSSWNVSGVLIGEK